MKTFYDFGEIIKPHTNFVIFGIPWDTLTTKRDVVSRDAPEIIRKVSYELALTTELGSKIPDLNVCDLGNVEIKLGEVSNNLTTIETFIHDIYKEKAGIVPVMVGGDHFCTYPTLKGINTSSSSEDVGVVVFDAHLDFYDEWEGNKFSHATISRRLLDLQFIDQQSILIVGARDVDIPEQRLAEEFDIEYINAYELNHNINEFTQRIINFFHDSNIEELYFSIDIDVLDPSIAPGTGYAIPGGFSYRELWHILRNLTLFFTIIGFDLIEVAPNLDLANNITCKTAAKIIIELISFIQNK
jgi:agmatinase